MTGISRAATAAEPCSCGGVTFSRGQSTMPAWAATGSTQTKNPVTTAVIAKRMSLRIALLLSRLFLLGHREFGAALALVGAAALPTICGQLSISPLPTGRIWLPGSGPPSAHGLGILGRAGGCRDGHHRAVAGRSRGRQVTFPSDLADAAAIADQVAAMARELGVLSRFEISRPVRLLGVRLDLRDAFERPPRTTATPATTRQRHPGASRSPPGGLRHIENRGLLLGSKINRPHFGLTCQRPELHQLVRPNPVVGVP
jgi:hypothetical protein